jgi:hypothetical protein
MVVAGTPEGQAVGMTQLLLDGEDVAARTMRCWVASEPDTPVMGWVELFVPDSDGFPLVAPDGAWQREERIGLVVWAR